MSVRIAVDQHGFKRDSVKRDESGRPVELVYYTGFDDVFADIDDVSVGDSATVMYVESDEIADGVVDEIRPKDAGRPWAGGLIYVRTDISTCRSYLT
jgi:hypothetical protein